ncbi:hypothetical protein CPLU01_12310 [Colletotrichum plurivorum]|uniref:Uncharacterized protein n=1 Tax=Colletotrichum plurivorum TaxID=2175906 RepID=A0A8H6N6F3_9PEZI|nr:hypothetical protein CPLU01_12310 [Colletotrichum plurivorum]
MTQAPKVPKVSNASLKEKKKKSKDKYDENGRRRQTTADDDQDDDGRRPRRRRTKTTTKMDADRPRDANAIERLIDALGRSADALERQADALEGLNDALRGALRDGENAAERLPAVAGPASRWKRWVFLLGWLALVLFLRVVFRGVRIWLLRAIAPTRRP